MVEENIGQFPYNYLCDFTQDLRRKRAELSVALRKQARDEQLLKRRALSPEAGEVFTEDKALSPSEIVQGMPDI